MNQVKAQERLQTIYEDWKASLHFSDLDASSLSPPLLLNITPEYAQSAKRVLVLGQETAGWQWTKSLRQDHPGFPLDWPYLDIWSMGDFMSDPDAVEALQWAYREFAFARPMPRAHRSPFWRAFREVQGWSQAGVMWGNIARSDYSPPGGSNNGYSILKAPEQIRNALITQQTTLLVSELAILNPDICVFFTGPRYDAIITAMFPECKFLPCDHVPVEEYARLVHPSLPTESFRTYHPRYLSLSRKWGHIEEVRRMAYAD